MLCQLSYSPGLRRRVYPPSRSTLSAVHRRALGILFAVLAAGLGLVAILSALEGGGAWVIALAAAAVALWLADLSRRALRPGRR